MSGAIWGIIHMDDKKASVEMGKSMMDKLSLYKLDTIKYFNKDNVFMGCGLQYITSESKKEILPLYDECRGLIITADAIIDNREELFNIFNISKELCNNITDSELIIRAYEKWGQDSPKYLIGDFAFVIWDENKKELFCARDHVGSRTLYYYYENNIFAFSTVMRPLFELLNKNIELNERWITTFLALPGVVHELDYEETIYNGIYQLPPTYTFTINSNKLVKKLYWNPFEEIKPLKLKLDKAYEEAFIKIFSEAVNCRLRSTDGIGVMLSGGLDSAAVASIAAENLFKNGKRLKAFSSIPMAEFKDNTSKYRIADESEYIKAISNYSGNMDVTYCRSEGKNSVTNMEYFIDIFEQPYKIIENLFWYHEIVERATQMGCRVLLNGQFGNSTISKGDFLTHIVTLYREKKFLTLIKEIKEASKLHNISSYKLTKRLSKVVAPYKLRKFMNDIRLKNYNRFSESPINLKLIRKWNVEEEFDEKDINQKTERYLDIYEDNRLAINPIAFSHIGAIETKLSLATGIIIRDPTKDKRVIEFCLSVPSEQFVRNGIERYLIRRAMSGIVPDKILLNNNKRGLQSADWLQRLEPYWEDICDEVSNVLNRENIKTYIDVEKMKKYFSETEGSLNDNNKNYIRMLLITLIFSKFLEQFDIKE